MGKRGEHAYPEIVAPIDNMLGGIRQYFLQVDWSCIKCHSEERSDEESQGGAEESIFDTKSG